MSVNTIKTLTLTLDADATPPGTSVECQLTTAQLVDNPTTEDLTTFCGTESSSIPNYELTLAGFQDYGQVTAICDLLHTAYVADPVDTIAAVLTVGGATRTFDCKPTADVPFGGDAGAALTFTTTLDVVGDITDGTAP